MNQSSQAVVAPSRSLQAAAVLLAALIPALAHSTAQAQANYIERFDSDPGGWSFYNDATNLRWDGTAGNPGGCIRANDSAGGTYWGFIAGPQFLGDRSCLYGGAISWELNTTLVSASAGASNPDITIIGGGLTLVRDMPVPVANTWTSFTVVLSETAGWRINTYTGAVPTQAQFMTVLSNITAIRFRAEYSSATDAARLDNAGFASFLLDPISSQSDCIGATVNFEAVFSFGSGNGPFTYQWRKNGQAIDILENPSAATSILTLTNIQDSDEATYDCIVSNSCGSTPSTAASLGVCACLDCPADFNQDGGIDGTDIEAFFAEWEAGSCDGDTNFDGGIDGADVDAFFFAWSNGGC